MSTSPAEQRKEEHKEGRDDLVQYVEELAGPEEYPEGDAWMSLTDAARITRTSEAMARRWVTSGRLKVKKEPVGVPPRTRLVRLSDVAKIRPIVDPTAAITGDVRKLDLPSIPRQQLQIIQDHERLTRQIERALEASKQQPLSLVGIDQAGFVAEIPVSVVLGRGNISDGLPGSRDSVMEQCSAVSLFRAWI